MNEKGFTVVVSLKTAVVHLPFERSFLQRQRVADTRSNYESHISDEDISVLDVFHRLVYRYRQYAYTVRIRLDDQIC